jgi:hypothetical protein
LAASAFSIQVCTVSECFLLLVIPAPAGLSTAEGLVIQFLLLSLFWKIKNWIPDSALRLGMTAQKVRWRASTDLEIVPVRSLALEIN